ncbi:DUF2085 domain-containing protein [Halorubrum sp. Atlit-26R]|uniref:DUF2085 domain-containing protein n=1 Tax=Halorubrum sp. Atlit-26R TaxID=2282128 RepID=UPI000EF17B70|nr:DUF2085 domain-containing protein [Halorubrum sp. Atlit-26R]
MSAVLEKVFRLSQLLRSYPFCHSRPERSFCYHGRYFGLCARCTTMYLGGLLTILAFPAWNHLLSPFQTFAIGAVCLFPGGIDGTTQMFGNRESNNTLRAITGFFLGIGVVLFLHGCSFQIF